MHCDSAGKTNEALQELKTFSQLGLTGIQMGIRERGSNEGHWEQQWEREGL